MVARKVEIMLAVDCIDIVAVLQAVGQPGHMRQQIDEAHRRGGCARREGYRPATAGIDRQVGKFGEYPSHGFLQRDLALFDQLHEGDRGYRLGHAGNAEQRVVAQFATIVAHRAKAGVVDRLAIARDQQLRVGQFAAVDIGLR